MHNTSKNYANNQLENPKDIKNNSQNIGFLSAWSNHFYDSAQKRTLRKIEDLCTQDNSGTTSLHLAAQRGFLLDGELFNLCPRNMRYQKDHAGQDLMHYASSGGQLDTVKWLKSQGFDINTKDKQGETPAYKAAFEGYLELLKWLVSEGADINVKNNRGEILAHKAALGGHLEVLKWLVSQGINITSPDIDGKNIVMKAMFGRNKEVLHYLKSILNDEDKQASLPAKNNSSLVKNTPANVTKPGIRPAVIENLSATTEETFTYDDDLRYAVDNEDWPVANSLVAEEGVAISVLNTAQQERLYVLAKNNSATEFIATYLSMFLTTTLPPPTTLAASDDYLDDLIEAIDENDFKDAKSYIVRDGVDISRLNTTQQENLYTLAKNNSAIEFIAQYLPMFLGTTFSPNKLTKQNGKLLAAAARANAPLMIQHIKNGANLKLLNNTQLESVFSYAYTYPYKNNTGIQFINDYLLPLLPLTPAKTNTKFDKKLVDQAKKKHFELMAYCVERGANPRVLDNTQLKDLFHYVHLQRKNNSHFILKYFPPLITHLQRSRRAVVEKNTIKEVHPAKNSQASLSSWISHLVQIGHQWIAPLWNPVSATQGSVATHELPASKKNRSFSIQQGILPALPLEKNQGPRITDRSDPCISQFNYFGLLQLANLFIRRWTKQSYSQQVSVPSVPQEDALAQAIEMTQQFEQAIKESAQAAGLAYHRLANKPQWYQLQGKIASALYQNSNADIQAIFHQQMLAITASFTMQQTQRFSCHMEQRLSSHPRLPRSKHTETKRSLNSSAPYFFHNKTENIPVLTDKLVHLQPALLP